MDDDRSEIHSSIEKNIEPSVFRAILQRIEKENEGRLKLLLDERNRPPLKVATLHGRSELAKVLLEFGANPLLKDKFSNLAVHTAAEYDQVEVLKVLLEYDKDLIEILSSDEWSPLLCAMYHTSKNAVTYMLEHHNPQCFAWNQECSGLGFETHPVYFAAFVNFAENSEGECYTNGEMIRMLLQSGCPPEHNGEHFIIHAARTTDVIDMPERTVDIMRNLVEHSNPSRNDLMRAKEIVEETQCLVANDEERENIIQVLSYLDYVLSDST